MFKNVCHSIFLLKNCKKLAFFSYFFCVFYIFFANFYILIRFYYSFKNIKSQINVFDKNFILIALFYFLLCLRFKFTKPAKIDKMPNLWYN